MGPVTTTNGNLADNDTAGYKQIFRFVAKLNVES